MRRNSAFRGRHAIERPSHPAAVVWTAAGTAAGLGGAALGAAVAAGGTPAPPVLPAGLPAAVAATAGQPSPAAVQDKLRAIEPAADTYVVRPGDTLSAIAARSGFGGNWEQLWAANFAQIPDPDLIDPGMVVRLAVAALTPAMQAELNRLLAPPVPSVPAPVSAPPPAGGAPVTVSATWSGVLTASQVGALWLQAGGRAFAEGTAECIADHESSDQPAINNYDDNGGTQTAWGLFQISNGTHEEPVPDIDNPLVNTEQAVIKSDGGTNWSQWGTAADCGV